MSTILTTGVRQNLTSLQSISSQQTTTEERLATGKKVHRAEDLPDYHKRVLVARHPDRL